MQSNAATPEEYVDRLDPDWRRDTLEQLRSIIQCEAGDLEESMHYKMLGYSSGEELIFHLNAQQNYVSLYVGDVTKIDPDREAPHGWPHTHGATTERSYQLV
ncbi:MAG: DUF1801 domain-containing protein [Ornithinimicrobium sp.]